MRTMTHDLWYELKVGFGIYLIAIVSVCGSCVHGLRMPFRLLLGPPFLQNQKRALGPAKQLTNKFNGTNRCAFLDI